MRGLNNVGILVKVLGALSLLLAIATTGDILFGNYNQQRLFELDRALFVESQKSQLIKNNEALLHKLTSVSVRRLTYRQIASSTQKKRAQILTRYWNNLYDYTRLPIRSMHLLDRRQNLLFDKGSTGISAPASDWMTNPISERSFFIDCVASCRLYIKVRLYSLQARQATRYFDLIYGLEMSQLKYDYYGSEGNQLMLIAESEDGGINIVMGTGSRFQQLVQTKVSATPQQLQTHTQLIDYNSSVYELHTLRLNNINLTQPVYVLFINDITPFANHMEQASRARLLFSLLSGLLLLLLLVLLLSPPLKRIRQIIHAIPLLASSSYVSFRYAVQSISRTPLYDESDRLSTVMLELSSQLETLESQLKQRAAELEWMANHDLLTDLPNRRYFESQLATVLAQGKTGCLLFVDLDNFKLVNDISGHGTGDEMLRQVTRVLSELLPDNVILARFSGDEFAICMPERELESATMIAQRLTYMLSQVRVAGPDKLHSASASVGVIAFPEHGDELEMLLSRGDMSLSQAKASGKNCVYSFSQAEAMDELSRLHYWRELAQHAITNSLLTLHYQPILNNHTQQVEHVEVLLRVKDDEGELHSPLQLILAAEKNGYIKRLDMWVLEQALIQLQCNIEQGYNSRFAINLSAHSFHDEKIILKICQLFERFELCASHVLFEITETAALPNMALAKKHIGILKQRGCCIALDDFGVGYSSFHSIKSLPLDFIKIDGSFVREVNNNPEDKMFIQALVEIAHCFGLQTVAEFVETPELKRLVIELGVDYSQGNDIGKAQSPELMWPETAATVLALN